MGGSALGDALCVSEYADAGKIIGAGKLVGTGPQSGHRNSGFQTKLDECGCQIPYLTTPEIISAMAISGRTEIYRIVRYRQSRPIGETGLSMGT